MEPNEGAQPIAWRRALPWLARLSAGCLALLGIAYLAFPVWAHWIAGASDWSVLEDAPLSPEARRLVDQHLEPLRGETLIDLHAHLAGRGQGSACWVHDDLRSRWHPMSWVRFESYLSAARMGSGDQDALFADRLFALTAAMPLDVQTHLLGFDFARDEAGKENRDGSFFHVPDEWIYAQAQRGGEGFRPAPSIHPRDPIALERLRTAAAQGARLIKWLPAAHNIDPASPDHEEFYREVIALDLTLLVHCGDEHAVVTPHGFELGNPLRLRRPLDMGVRIVVAHCATSGTGEDLDQPGAPRQPNHRLFLRLMDDRRYEGHLFGEISTITQVNHYQNGLADLLERTDLHPRLINGSDWPLPAIHVLYQLAPLTKAGFLAPEDRAPLAELYDYNPLLFDLILKRAVRHPETGAKFADEIFVVREERPF